MIIDYLASYSFILCHIELVSCQVQIVMRQDIKRTVKGALEMSRLVKENRYDERVLSISH